jgi:agmatine/peptidylarginine deiminase
MPSDARIPGEFEESQAVSIAWVDNFPGPGPDVTTEYGDLWAKMTDAIQKECTVWIRIKDGADSTTIKNFMTTKGTPLTNYKFHVMVGDDFWIRDYGPIGFYYGANDDIGLLDMNYYPGRDNDDLYPGLLAGVTGYLDVKTNLYAEGGNFFTDGFKNSFHSNVVESVNTTANPKHGAWSMGQTQDTIKYVWASNNVTSTPTLKCDGGTGHNDMYMKLMDENTMAIMEYPNVVTAQDRTIIQNVITTVTGMKNVYGKPYRIYKVPMPTQDNGDTLKSCGAINNDARTFVNGLTVNKTYLMPSYSDGTSGNQAQNTAAANLQYLAVLYTALPCRYLQKTLYTSGIRLL